MTSEEAKGNLIHAIRWNDMPKKEALDMAIKALETLEEFEKAQIIMGGRLNGRTYAYKCGLKDGKRKALEQEPCDDAINRQPEIIRCGQCKYAEVADSEDSQDGYTCQFHRGSIWFSGSYCSWAERRKHEFNNNAN